MKFVAGCPQAAIEKQYVAIFTRELLFRLETSRKGKSLAGSTFKALNH